MCGAPEWSIRALTRVVYAGATTILKAGQRVAPYGFRIMTGPAGAAGSAGNSANAYTKWLTASQAEKVITKG